MFTYHRVELTRVFIPKVCPYYAAIAKSRKYKVVLSTVQVLVGRVEMHMC
jgi:hypothetical protein